MSYTIHIQRVIQRGAFCPFRKSKYKVIQTEAERRRCEAGVKQSMEIRLRSCMYVCGYVCMVFGIISRTKACSATNEVSECRSPERALLNA